MAAVHAGDVRAAGDPVDLVKDRAADRRRSGGAPFLHAYDPASVPDRPGPHGLGTARDLHLCRSSLHRVDVALHPPVGPGPCGQAQQVDGPHSRLAGSGAGRDEHRRRRAAAVTAPASELEAWRGRSTSNAITGGSCPLLNAFPLASWAWTCGAATANAPTPTPVSPARCLPSRR